jgi:hypothetical protein
VKTGGRLVKDAHYYWLALAESQLTRRLFTGMLRTIAMLRVPTGLGCCVTDKIALTGGGRDQCVKNPSSKAVEGLRHGGEARTRLSSEY